MYDIILMILVYSLIVSKIVEDMFLLSMLRLTMLSLLKKSFITKDPDVLIFAFKTYVLPILVLIGLLLSDMVLVY